MHHNQQKRKLTEYLDGIYKILKQKQYIKRTPETFRKDWNASSYENGLCSLCIDILYSVVMKHTDRLNGFRDAIRIDYAGNIEAFLNGNGFIQAKVKKPKKGMSALCWEMLEKLQQNDLKYFDDLYVKIQEKNQEKSQEKDLTFEKQSFITMYN